MKKASDTMILVRNILVCRKLNETWAQMDACVFGPTTAHIGLASGIQVLRFALDPSPLFAQASPYGMFVRCLAVMLMACAIAQPTSQPM